MTRDCEGGPKLVEIRVPALQGNGRGVPALAGWTIAVGGGPRKMRAKVLSRYLVRSSSMARKNGLMAAPATIDGRRAPMSDLSNYVMAAAAAIATGRTPSLIQVDIAWGTRMLPMRWRSR